MNSNKKNYTFNDAAEAVKQLKHLYDRSIKNLQEAFEAAESAVASERKHQLEDALGFFPSTSLIRAGQRLLAPLQDKLAVMKRVVQVYETLEANLQTKADASMLANITAMLDGKASLAALADFAAQLADTMLFGPDSADSGTEPLSTFVRAMGPYAEPPRSPDSSVSAAPPDRSVAARLASRVRSSCVTSRTTSTSLSYPVAPGSATGLEAAEPR